MEFEKIEAQLRQMPLYQYGFMRPEELPFSSRVRQVCQQECPMYGRSWSCPPAVGDLEQCRARCLSYDHALLLVTVQEVADSTDLAAVLATRPFHRQQVRHARQILRQAGCRPLCLSGEACDICDICTCPDVPCRHPEWQTPCLEGYGIVASELAERYGVPFPPEPGLVYWYALLLF